MDKINLEELERLHKAATPGPWEIVDARAFLDDEDYEIRNGQHCIGYGTSEADASYIVAACNSLPELIAENRALRERVRELEELCGNLNREVVNLMGSFPVTDCRICDYSYWCTREKTQIDPDFDMCKAAILEFCKPDSEEAGE